MLLFTSRRLSLRSAQQLPGMLAMANPGYPSNNTSNSQDDRAIETCHPGTLRPSRRTRIESWTTVRRNYHVSASRSFLLPLLALVPVAVPAVYFGRKYLRAQQLRRERVEDQQWHVLQEQRKADQTSGKEYNNIVLDLGTTDLKTVAFNNPTVQSDFQPDALWALQSSTTTNATTNSLNSKALFRLVRHYLQKSMQQPVDSRRDHVRVVLTVPPKPETAERYRHVLQDSLPSDSSVVWLPEPVAAIWGAQVLHLLPIPHDPRTLVIDIGGRTSTVSLVEKDHVLAATVLPNIGGQVLIDAYQRNEPHSTWKEAQQAVLDCEVAAHLYSDVEATVLQEALPKLYRGVHLSDHLPKPTTLETLWESAVAHLLETLESSSSLRFTTVVVVGGASNNETYQHSLQAAVTKTVAPQSVDWILPSKTDRSQLVTLGARSMMASCDYSFDKGLCPKSNV